MIWLPEKHKTLISARFIVASKNCSTKRFSDTIAILSSNLKSKIKSAFFKHLSIGCLRELKKDTSLNKLLLMLFLSS